MMTPNASLKCMADKKKFQFQKSKRADDHHLENQELAISHDDAKLIS